MPTTKKRINVSLSDELNHALEIVAKRDELPIATKAVYLIKIAMEIEEDDILNGISEERDNKAVKSISHKDAWK